MNNRRTEPTRTTEVLRVPVKNMIFQQETKQLRMTWVYANCFTYAIFTFLLLNLSLYFIFPHSIYGRLSTFFTVVMLAFIPSVCFVPYTVSFWTMRVFGFIMRIYRLMGLVRIIHSLIAIDLIDITPIINGKKVEWTLENDISTKQLKIEIFILFITIIGASNTFYFFKDVVLAKKRALQPKLTIAWMEVDKKQNETPESEVTNFINFGDVMNKLNNQTKGNIHIHDCCEFRDLLYIYAN